MLVDGLGHDLLAEHRAQAPYLHSMLGSVPGQATCGVPSTTATSLTSLGTALTPGQHGLVGFTSRVPETGALLNALFWDQPVDPLEWQPNPTAFARLEVGCHSSGSTGWSQNSDPLEWQPNPTAFARLEVGCHSS